MPSTFATRHFVPSSCSIMNKSSVPLLHKQIIYSWTLNSPFIRHIIWTSVFKIVALSGTNEVLQEVSEF